MGVDNDPNAFLQSQRSVTQTLLRDGERGNTGRGHGGGGIDNSAANQKVMNAAAFARQHLANIQAKQFGQKQKNNQTIQ